MTPFVLFAALSAQGLRPPWLWTLFAVLSWGLALAARPGRRLPGAALWAAALAWALLSAALSAEPWLALAAFAYAAAGVLWLWLGAARADAEERLWGERLLWGGGLISAAAALLVRVPSFQNVGLFYPYYNYTAALTAAAGAAALAAWAFGRGPAGL
ncbi:MAG: hypothetical protein KGL53_10050, partial [Elusimicrobia bacterium]|nr:hypothetical protein [Elusimicrobiota bacterium]